MIIKNKENRKKISSQCFSDIIIFYNKYEKIFNESEKKLGVNVWFLQNFRIYMKYRNILLNVLKNNKKKNKIQIISEKTKTSFRIIIKLFYMLIKYKSPPLPKKNISSYQMNMMK